LGRGEASGDDQFVIGGPGTGTMRFGGAFRTAWIFVISSGTNEESVFLPVRRRPPGYTRIQTAVLMPLSGAEYRHPFSG
jgi:hypothetical protein